MRALVAGLVVLALVVPAWAGDKEEAELKLYNFNLQMENLNLKARMSVASEMQELNKQVQEFQKELTAKGLMVDDKGKIVPRPKDKPPEKPAEKK